MRNHRQVVVAVNVCVAMPGEVLGAGDNAMVLHALHVLNAPQGYIVLVFAEGAVVDYRIADVVVDVYYRGKVDLHTYPPAMGSYHLSHIVHKGGVLDGTQGQLPGERPGGVEAHPQPPLGILPYQQGNVAFRL